MPTCPICGSPHDTWGGVATHCWKKTDSEHEHIESKDDGIVWLSSNGHIDTDTSPETSRHADPDTSADTQQMTDSNPPEFPENPDSTDTTEQAEQNDKTGSSNSCERCGSQNIRSSTAVEREYADELTSEQMQVLQSADYVCIDCKGAFSR